MGRGFVYYFNKVIIYIVFSIGLASIIVLVNYILAPKALYSEKVSAY
jgi:hypothetical protein